MKYYFTGIQILFFTALLIFSSCNLSDNVDEFNNSNFVGSQKCKECHKKEYGLDGFTPPISNAKSRFHFCSR